MIHLYWTNPLTCYTLSRLKGMETRRSIVENASASPCYTLSRLKGIETYVVASRVAEAMCFACYTLSRLKGMET